MIEALLSQITQVHYAVRPDIFRPFYKKVETDSVVDLQDAEAPVFVAVSKHNCIIGCLWCIIKRERNNSLKVDRDWLVIDDICVDEKYYITGEDIIQMDYIYRPITIRLAVPADAPDMAEVHMCSWEAAYKDIIPAEYIREKNATRPALYERVITEGNTNSYVIQHDGKTIGIMRIASPQDDDVGDNFYELHYIYLHPDYFRMGIGTQAMKFAFDIARGLGRTEMTVWVFAENANTIKFYEKCGFVPDGKTKTHDMGKSMGSIRMRRGL